MSLTTLRPHKLTEAEVRAIIRGNEKARRERLRYDGRQSMSIRGYPFKIAVPHGYGNGGYGTGPTRFMLGHIEFQVAWKINKDGEPSETPELIPHRKLPLSWIINLDEPNYKEVLQIMLEL
jgi:hypothetical protein